MPKTLPIGRSGLERTAKPAPLGALAAFVIVYLALLGVLFAPEGFFLSSSTPVASAE